MLARQSFTRVCPCVGGRCLTASFSGLREVGRQEFRRRDFSTASNPLRPNSIFSPEADPWDEIFDDIKDMPRVQPPPTVNPRSLKSASIGRVNSQDIRKVAMTRQESVRFSEMFDSIFKPNSSAAATGGIGEVPGDSPVADQLRTARRLRWTSDADQELDRKKEEMELCESDLQLLEWAMREVFGESERYAEAAARTSSESRPFSVSTKKSTPDASSDLNLPLQPLSYPHLLAALMRTFRDKYRDPHLTLAMFDHARNLSIASFVFGCTTPAYNELIETRWRCFRDLRGVTDALEEMRVNGIEMDGRTRMLAETIRREVGERTLWQEESSLGSGEVWEMVARIERLTVVETPKTKTKRQSITATSASTKPTEHAPARRSRRWGADQEMWKREALDSDARDNWGFDKWAPKKTRPAQKRPLLL
ncbi:hypothetical protein BD311DRAFT_791919 [Dichomitus squalens]|uniref:Mtf2-like C-terminal domain-containing protein n=1 Tax=Dichomitus squalens TaxID=114155 RepID=A0A4Q9MBG7_9APHY|nr:hypothetical protein BD311DRAFT_791919 [Dichomitus squalens]